MKKCWWVMLLFLGTTSWGAAGPIQISSGPFTGIGFVTQPSDSNWGIMHSSDGTPGKPIEEWLTQMSSTSQIDWWKGTAASYKSEYTYMRKRMYEDPTFHKCDDDDQRPFVLFLPATKTKIHYAKQKVVDKHCKYESMKHGWTNDDGTKVGSKDWIIGCNQHNTDTGQVDIWIRFCAGAQVLAHELAHSDPAYTPEEVDMMLPGDFN